MTLLIPSPVYSVSVYCHLVNALQLVSDDIIHVHPEHDDALPQHGDHVERVEEVVEDLLRLVLNIVNAVLLDQDQTLTSCSSTSSSLSP